MSKKRNLDSFFKANTKRVEGDIDDDDDDDDEENAKKVRGKNMYL